MRKGISEAGFRRLAWITGTPEEVSEWVKSDVEGDIEELMYNVEDLKDTFLRPIKENAGPGGDPDVLAELISDLFDRFQAIAELANNASMKTPV